MKESKDNKTFRALTKAFEIIALAYIVALFALAIISDKYIMPSYSIALSLNKGVDAVYLCCIGAIIFAMPIVRCNKRIPSVAAALFYFADIVCAVYCLVTGAFEKITEMLQLGTVIWQIPFVLDLLFLALLIYRIIKPIKSARKTQTAETESNQSQPSVSGTVSDKIAQNNNQIK